jgi:hypothetical protein
MRLQTTIFRWLLIDRRAHRCRIWQKVVKTKERWLLLEHSEKTDADLCISHCGNGEWWEERADVLSDAGDE